MDKKYKLFIILGVIVLLGIIIVISVMLIKTTNIMGITSHKDASKIVNKKDILLLHIKEPIISNIKNEENGNVWIKVEIALQVNKSDRATKKFIKQFKEAKTGKETVIRDTIIRVLKEQTYESIMKQEAQDKIREQIQSAVNEVLDGDIIKGIYFGEFIIQQ